MRGLFLYGICCTNEIWSDLLPYLTDYDIDCVEYPHEITQNAKTISEITDWVARQYEGQTYDFIIGHSMGGIIALEIAVRYECLCNKVIFIESNLKPANEFYRNLLTPEHMKEYGNDLIHQMQKENPYYTISIKQSLQDEFDYTDYVKKSKKDIYAIYGDRGQENYVNRIKDLNLDKDTCDKLQFEFITDACHMPMLENPVDLAETIIRIVM